MEKGETRFFLAPHWIFYLRIIQGIPQVPVIHLKKLWSHCILSSVAIQLLPDKSRRTIQKKAGQLVNFRRKNVPDDDSACFELSERLMQTSLPQPLQSLQSWRDTVRGPYMCQHVRHQAWQPLGQALHTRTRPQRWHRACSHQAPGAGGTAEPLHLILKWERAARSSLHTAFPPWSGITVGSKASMFSHSRLH